MSLFIGKASILCIMLARKVKRLIGLGSIQTMHSLSCIHLATTRLCRVVWLISFPVSVWTFLVGAQIVLLSLVLSFIAKAFS